GLGVWRAQDLFCTDDLALKSGPALGVLLARQEPLGEQRVELGLTSARADQGRAREFGSDILRLYLHAEPEQDTTEGQALRHEREKGHAEHDRDQPFAIGE